MTWLTPLTGFLLGAALIPPLVFLYFLKLRRRTQPIACTLLWKRSIEDLQANAPFQRLRRNILLFLQLLALILLGLSVAQPQVQAGELKGGRTVFLIDNSASMTATDLPNGFTRLEEAKRLARERIEAMYGGGLFGGAPGETMIVAFSDRAEVVARFTNVRQQLIAAIDRIQPTHGETRIDEALKLARAYTTNVVDEMGEARPIGEPAHLELFSDGRIADIADHVLRGESMTYHAIGTLEPDNVAIVSVSVERPYDRPSAVEVFASLLNFNRTEVICDVQLSVNGTARGIREVKIGPATIDPSTDSLIPGRNNVVFVPFEQPRDAVIEVANLRQDHLMADNVAQIVVPPAKRLRIALIDGPSRLRVTRMALESLQLERIEVIQPEEYERLADAGLLEQFDVIVFESYAPPEGKMPAGRYLSFGPTPPLAGLNDYGAGERQLILANKAEHPVFRFVTLDDLIIDGFRLLQPADDVQVIAEGSRGPAIIALSRGPLHVIHCTFTPVDSTWPLQRGFVNFVSNAVEYLGHIGEGLTSQGLKPGDAITARLPISATDVQLMMPDGAVERLTPSDPLQFSWGPTRLAGPHVLSWNDPGMAGRQSRAFAVNLLSETEGLIAVNPTLQIGLERVEGKLGGGVRYKPLWPWAIGFVLALLMVEWWVYHRKTYL